MSRHFARAFALSLLLAGAAAAQPPAPTHKIVATDRQTVNATITYEITTTKFAVARWMVFLPEPPELPSQTKVKASVPNAKVVAEKSALARKVQFIDVPVANPAPGGKLGLKLDIEAVLRARELVPLEKGEKVPKVAALTDAEKKHYLAPGEQIDFDAPTFKSWMADKKLKAKKDEPPLDLAARVLEVIRADVRFRFDLKDDKRVSAACARSSTDGAGMAYLFVAAMRDNKVPARALVGRLAAPRKAGAKPGDAEYDQPHVRAEVYVAGVGWVPVNAVGANLYADQPIKSFIGNDPGDLLVLHVDPDLLLQYPAPAPPKPHATLLQIAPHYQAMGKGGFDAEFGPTGWELKATPIEKK